MSAKRRNVEAMEAAEVSDPAEGSDSSGSESEEDSELQTFVNQRVLVDFEGRCPTQTDYHGIRQLLQTSLPRAHLNWGELADTIIGQSYVGSVLKQCEEEGPDADDDDEAMDADSDKEVFGITTVVNLTQRQELESVQQLKRALLGRCKESGAPPEVRQQLEDVLSSTDDHCGWLVNERFVNIPLPICVPLLTALRDEIEEAVQKQMPYKFSHFLLISKLHKSDRKKAKGKKGQEAAKKQEVTWVNGEEEILDKAAECSFEFSVAAETDTAVDGAWTDRDTRLIPFRRVMLLPVAALLPALEEIRSAVQALPS